MAQRNNFDYDDRDDRMESSQRSGYGYQQDMPRRNDYGGYRAQNELERNRQFRGMNQNERQAFEQPQHYRMDFDRNRESSDRGDRGARSFGYRGDSTYSRSNSSSAQDMGFRSASSDMPSADRYRTRGFDDDGPGLYGGAEDYGHAGFQERFDYGAERYPNVDRNREMGFDGRTRGASNGGGAAWSYERERSGSSNFSSDGYRGTSASVGPHRGKGPKNYSRSDDRIREDACERLMHDGDVDASEIEVKVSAGEVTLSGSVNSKDEKRRAEDAVERISGVKDVHNELRVESSSDESRSASSTSNSDTSSNGQSRSNTSRNSARVS